MSAISGILSFGRRFAAREGNCVISDPAVHPKAFDWQAAFPEASTSAAERMSRRWDAPPRGSGPYTYEPCEEDLMPDYENVLTD